jgi:hypothetical protein
VRNVLRFGLLTVLLASPLSLGNTVPYESIAHEEENDTEEGRVLQQIPWDDALRQLQNNMTNTTNATITDTVSSNATTTTTTTTKQNETTTLNSTTTTITWINLLSAVPCTAADGVTPLTYFRSDPKNPSQLLERNIGVSHMAAALMAMTQFNDRNPAVIPQLTATSPYLLQDCEMVQFDIQGSAMVNSQGSKHATLGALLEHVTLGEQMNQQEQQQQQDRPSLPNALINGYYFRDEPSLQLSVAADTLRIPFVTTGGLDGEILSSSQRPQGLIDITPTPYYYTSRVFADVFAVAEALLSYLEYIQRDKFVGLLYSTNPAEIQLHEAIQSRAAAWREQRHGTRNANQQEEEDTATPSSEQFRFYSRDYVSGSFAGIEHRSIDVALHELDLTGFRTIVILLHDFQTEIPLLAKVLRETGMHRDDYAIIFLGDFDVEQLLTVFKDVEGTSTTTTTDDLDDETLQLQEDMVRLIIGSAVFQPVEPFMYNNGFNSSGREMDRFLDSWMNQGQDMVDLVNSKLPMIWKDNGVVMNEEQQEQQQKQQHYLSKIDSSFFESSSPGLGAAFVYDAVIAIGMGFCRAHQQELGRQHGEDQNRTATTTQSEPTALLVDSIRQSSFDGATGHVAFESSRDNSFYPGQRIGDTISFAVYNILSPTTARITDVLEGSVGQEKRRPWQSLHDFLYSDGTTSPPLLLRTVPEQNYIGKGPRIWGFFLLSACMVINLSLMVWVHLNREVKVVKAAQPEFLHMITVGATLLALTIFPNSFDESHGWDAKMIGRACTSSPWLVSTGFMLIYTGLWLKLWRINKVNDSCQMRPSQIGWKFSSYF